MNVEMFARQIQAIHGRLHEMYQATDCDVELQPHLLLPTAFKELGTASEELQVAAEELFEQTETLVATRAQVEAERQRYRDLFESMPNAYLVTDLDGKIQEANRAAALLLNVQASFLIDKLLINFIPPQARRAFRSKLAHLQLSEWVKEFSVALQPRNSELIEAAITVAPVRDSQGNLATLRWIVRDITETQRVLRSLDSPDYDLSLARPLHFYSKGEVIPLEPQMIWLVCQGWVKLSTLSERGEEVLLGLVGRQMPFGSGMTSLPTYQAIALSEEVQLVSIPMTEIYKTVRLSQSFLPKITQRLRQTEALLAISGKRQVKERLHYFLQFLKQEIGQPMSQGIRLSVRLTHQDLADACCTTRVTITRLVGKLQQQGKIAFDSKHHMILKD
ncbi:MAG TPA: PAS domain S-box protein [Candidatus Sericytochromatia bacterium]|jgi:PAS domain S-box-containing protein